MATVSLRGVPVFNAITNKYESSELVVGSDGTLTRISTVVFSQEESESVDSIINASRAEEITFVEGQDTYYTQNNFNDSSLNVYINGSNITPDIQSFGDNYFQFSSDYVSSLSTSDRIFVTYLESVSSGV